MILKMLQTTPRYAGDFATQVWMRQVPIADKLILAWNELKLNETVGEIFNTTGRNYDIWNETQDVGEKFWT